MLKKTYINGVKADTYSIKGERKHFIPKTAKIKDYNGKKHLIITVLFYDRHSKKWRQDTDYIKLDNINQKFLEKIMEKKELK